MDCGVPGFKLAGVCVLPGGGALVFGDVGSETMSVMTRCEPDLPGHGGVWYVWVRDRPDTMIVDVIMLHSQSIAVPVPLTWSLETVFSMTIRSSSGVIFVGTGQCLQARKNEPWVSLCNNFPLPLVSPMGVYTCGDSITRLEWGNRKIDEGKKIIGGIRFIVECNKPRNIVDRIPQQPQSKQLNTNSESARKQLEILEVVEAAVIVVVAANDTEKAVQTKKQKTKE